MPIKTAVAGWKSTIDEWAERLLNTYSELATPWVIGQLVLIAVAYGFAVLAAARLEPRLEARLRQINRQPQLLRLLVTVLRRLKWIFFALLLWFISIVMVEITWPSRSYFIRIAAHLVTAWVIISLLSRTFRNRSLARIVAAIAWIVAALLITGLFDSVVSGLDALGLQVGASRITLLALFKAGIILSILFWFAWIVGELAEQRLQLLEFDPAVAVLLGKAVKGGLFIVAFFTAMQVIGLDVTAFAVFSGAFGLGIGFGLQKVASNLISGFIILMDRSIKPGDVISLGHTFGWITSLRARYVSVSTRDGIEYLIPNESFITERLLNMSFSDRAIRLDVKFGVSYESDPHLVKRLAVETVINRARVLADPPPICHIVAFGDSSIDFVLRYWISDPEMGITNIKGDTFLALLDTFKAHGIKIPYPHREVLIQEPDNRPRG